LRSVSFTSRSLFSQFIVGRRFGDIAITGWFSVLAAVHIVAALG
jgi:hypothetical protein